ncbi:relaxase/mobilization nuclease domain-containing protein [Arenibacter sp. F20364]|uniref:relaxase/mobilization nuclease domain-containing protein n=1 Tax=Arenibacter sp. F20364 TaxID=2926415 RepID=UPI001FF62E6B|nr:relaxase/mobilization nuclease domain-containing protein [Arenibacter sp. F20364]MCK0190674.1 relaxase/mobilization nuclease domain-containing protein [Arenibacter sp. F20364]|tara:strand:+ start:39953 stop:42262 length:2310 start_codon:yes stop_codon:yes gene_type:complete
MIGQIIYGETCKGTLNYVFGKEGMLVLGYGNTFSQNISPKFFGNVLHFQGQRNATKNRYVHISLNLPHGEHLDDKTFYKISKEYMDNMGYGEQPYVVVRHNDTKHEHVHIVTTNVKEDGKVLGIFNSYRRNIATHQYLERKYNLSPSPKTKQERELPIYRLPELQFGMDAEKGTKNYLQDVLNGINQKYKVRSFDELAKLVKPYHIKVKQTKSEPGRIGVAYGLNNQKGYRTRFINGSAVHRGLSGPKLQKVFDAHSKSKLLPIHRKRLLKQIETTYDLFQTIHPHDLEDVVKEYQDLDIKLDMKEETIEGFTIYDNSRYVFKAKELGKNIRLENRKEIFGNGKEPTQINTESKQFKLEIQKVIKEALTTSYLKSPRPNGLFSEHIMTMKFGDIVPNLMASKEYDFLERYIPGNQRTEFRKAMENAFPMVRERLYEIQTKKEKEILESKFKLIGKVLKEGVFDVGTEQGSVRLLFQSLGVKYHSSKLSFTNSNRHSVPVPLGHLPIPEHMEKYVSSGFVRQNHLMLEMLSEHSSENSPKLTASAIFLPMIFPKLYKKMNPIYKQKYESVSLASYIDNAERMHAPFEKSPKDYIALFNAKGFYFEKGKEGFEVKSIYTDNKSSCTLPKRTSQYLSSIPDLTATLQGQQPVINNFVEEGRSKLENLWAGHLMERGMYDKATYMITAENVRPNLHRDIVQHHMGNGLRKSLNEVVARTTNVQYNRKLRKGVYAISSLLESSSSSEEMFNGFKDEFTDFTKLKRKGKDMGLSF